MAPGTVFNVEVVYSDKIGIIIGDIWRRNGVQVSWKAGFVCVWNN